MTSLSMHDTLQPNANKNPNNNHLWTQSNTQRRNSLAPVSLDHFGHRAIKGTSFCHITTCASRTVLTSKALVSKNSLSVGRQNQTHKFSAIPVKSKLKVTLEPCNGSDAYPLTVKCIDLSTSVMHKHHPHAFSWGISEDCGQPAWVKCRQSTYRL